ncbi:MAG: exo-alpha-sialidase [Treponema sp.]|nr:exo-alpha-sialidase [Treponema sp.]
MQLQDGRVLLTYGDRNPEQNRILLKLSSDNGLSWGEEVQLGENFGCCDFGYPSTVEMAPGKLLTVFYVNKSEEPYYFFFNNPVLYSTEYAKGYYYLHSLD